MTKLLKLKLKNFKSFKRAELPIADGFTAIVGSNGSGKSNILDAILFVLGITSLKTLRAGKLTDLVNTDAKENYAKVDLNIKENGKEYEISRMIDKQGKSVYRLDGKRTTLNEISSLLTELGIDVDGHNIVTQGDITKIIEMSPIERREVIDSVAGLSEFDEKKEEALKELQKVDSKIKEATIILNERNSFLNELEREMTAAKEFNELEEEKKRTKSTILSKELHLIEKKILEIENEIKSLKAQKELLEKHISECNFSIQEAKKKSNELSKQIIKSSEQTYSTIGKAYQEKKAKLMVEQEKLSFKQAQITKNEEKIMENLNLIDLEEKEKIKYKEKINLINGELSALQLQISEESKKKELIEESINSVQGELNENEKLLEELDTTLEKIAKDIIENESILKSRKKSKAINEKRLSSLLIEEENSSKEIEQIKKNKEIIINHSKKNPEKVLEELEKNISELFEQKNLLITKRINEEKAVLELKKQISTCPVCESALNETKKSKIIAQRELLIKEFKSKEIEKAVQIEEIKKKIILEKESIMIISKLTAQTQHEDLLKKKLLLISSEINEIKKEISQNNAELEETLGMLREKSNQIKIEKDSLKKEIKRIKSQNIFKEYSEISKKIDAMINKKFELAEQINKLNSLVESINSRVENILEENSLLEKENDLQKKSVCEIEESIKLITNEIESKENDLKDAKDRQKSLENEKEIVDKNIEKSEKEISNELLKLKKIDARIAEFNIESSKLSVRKNDLDEERKIFENIEPYSSKSLEECKERLAFIEKRLSEIGAVNLRAVDNFNQLKIEVEDTSKKLTKLSEERLAVLDMIDKIEVKRTNVFMECFNQINKNFQNLFFKFFNGEGNLSFSDESKPLESGLIINAKQKAGRLQNIDSMSGGEKTLTALAFMFAIQLYRPAPFYAFDEADAALDKENSLKMGNLIEKISEKSQFIAITHNDVITKKAHQIVGVARGKDDSSVIGLRLRNKNKLEASTQIN